jgi:hypothetical protein
MQVFFGLILAGAKPSWPQSDFLFSAGGECKCFTVEYWRELNPAWVQEILFESITVGG